MGNKMIDIEGISAVTMFVSEMDRAVDFYESLGFKVCYGGRGETFSERRTRIFKIPSVHMLGRFVSGSLPVGHPQ